MMEINDNDESNDLLIEENIIGRDIAAEKYIVLQTKFQRDFNRISDTDRNTRKRGLQKLIDELPWSTTNKMQKKALANLISAQLLNPLITIVSDQVEKCRELSLTLILKTLELCNSGSALKILTREVFINIIQCLCSRIGDYPFLETSEELRLQIVDLILVVLKHQQCLKEADLIPLLAENILQSLSKGLNDSFPSVKRSGAEIVCYLSLYAPEKVRITFKSILKPLILNATHQHSKTRNITLKAIGLGIGCISEEYESLMKESILPLLLKMVADRSSTTRKELGNVISTFQSSRLLSSEFTSRELLDQDIECISILLLLRGDDTEDVVNISTEGFFLVIKSWYKSRMLAGNGIFIANNESIVDKNLPSFSQNSHIVDGEFETRKSEQEMNLSNNENKTIEDFDIPEDEIIIKTFLNKYLSKLVEIIVENIDGWTTDSRRRYLKSLRVLLTLTGNEIDPYLPKLLSSLSIPIKDDDSEVRIEAELCCSQLGSCVMPHDALDLLLPRVSGEVAGGDTFSQRISALRVLTHVLEGFGMNSIISSQNDTIKIITNSVSAAICKPTLFEFREAALREAILLLLRSLIKTFPIQCKNIVTQENLILSSLFLMGRMSGEVDVVPEVAYNELCRLSILNSMSIEVTPDSFINNKVAKDINESISNLSKDQLTDKNKMNNLISKNYLAILNVIAPADVKLEWTPHSPCKSAFESLVRECPKMSWKCHATVLPIILSQLKSKPKPEKDSAEANMQNYLAIKGEEIVIATGEVDIRLSLLALLEGLLRAGSADWECSPYIADSAILLLKEAILPNLVWKVGRVEATIRKVALALCYGVLKAGSVPSESLFKIAGELVPMIVSNLDDFDVSPRQMSILCLTVIFERLRGAFGDQAVHEIYPKLLKRLDDSNDGIRISICHTLNMFFQAAPKSCYSSTTIEYTLDQLFIHLDDPDPTIQQAVYEVIIRLSTLSKDIVLKKTEKNRISHRSPDMCDRIQTEVQGFEIIR